jgi:hypothetical protein
MIWVLFPDTLGIPLAEVAAIFGDESEISRAETEAEKAVSMTGAEEGSPGKVVQGSEEGDAEKGHVIEARK